MELPHTTATQYEVLDVFEALETVDMDEARLLRDSRELERELVEPIEDPDVQQAALNDLVSAVAGDHKAFAERRSYAVNSIAGRVGPVAIRQASEAYLRQYGAAEPPARWLAGARLQNYQLRLGYRAPTVNAGGALPQVAQYRVVHATPDDENSGKFWLSLTDPRVLEVAEMPADGKALHYDVRRQDLTVTRYAVDRMEADPKTGDWLVTVGTQHRYWFDENEKMWKHDEIKDSGRVIRVADDSDVYRLSTKEDKGGEGVYELELYVPAGRTSVFEAMFDAPYLDGARSRDTGRVALAAAGDYQHHIIDTFDAPVGNPIPIAVGKTK